MDGDNYYTQSNTKCSSLHSNYTRAGCQTTTEVLEATETFYTSAGSVLSIGCQYI